MSKKRLFGLTKWRLGKLEGDYKSHIQKKKGLNYLEEDKVKARPIKKYPCKRLKGEHDFVLVEEEEVKWMNSIFKKYECSGCGKKNWDIKKYDKIKRKI